LILRADRRPGKADRRRFSGKAALVVAAGVVVGLGLLAILWLRDDGPEPITWHVAAGAWPGGRGHADRPFATIQLAIDAARPGDTVEVSPGRYPGGLHSVRSGRAGARIALRGHDAIVVAGDATYLIEITHDRIDLTGFDLRGGNSTVRLYGASHVRVRNNTIRDAEGECVRIKNNSVRNEIGGNRISGCGRRNFDLGRSTKNGEGVYIGTAPEQHETLPGGGPDRSDHNWVHDNRVQAPAECVDVKEESSYTRVERNDCTGTRDPDGAAISVRGDRGMVWRNSVHGGAGAGIRLGGDGKAQGVWTTVVGNVVVDAAGYGVKIIREPQRAVCENTLDAAKGATNDGDTRPAAPCR
jgi:parallel beta-helix repeat protein